MTASRQGSDDGGAVPRLSSRAEVDGMSLEERADLAARLDGVEVVRSASRWLSVYAKADAPAPPPLREMRDAFERSYLDMVLQRTNGNVAAAAKIAGRNRTDFYDLLRRHGRSTQRAE